MSNKLFKAKIVLLILLIGCVLNGSIFAPPEVTLDTDKNPIYEYYALDKIMGMSDKDARNVNGDLCVTYGVITEIKRSGEFKLLSPSGKNQDGILCIQLDKDAKEKVKTIQEGTLVQVYGKFVLDVFGDLRIKPLKVIKEPLVNSADKAWFSLSGQEYPVKNKYKRELNDGKVTFFIPPSWHDVEHSIRDEELGIIEGYQYELNTIPGDENSTSESVFICYFNNAELLEKKSDASQTELVEKAIIKNIQDIEASPVLKNKRTYYGAQYTYFQTTYRHKNSLNSKDGYHVEYVFEKIGKDGLVVYVYVYKKPHHLNDIMFVMRNLTCAASK